LSRHTRRALPHSVAELNLPRAELTDIRAGIRRAEPQGEATRARALQRARLKSERSPSASAKPTSEQKTPKPRDPERLTLETTALPEETKEHAAPTSCPKCGGEELKELSSSEEQIEYVMRPASAEAAQGSRCARARSVTSSAEAPRSCRASTSSCCGR
jgi:hypothetical protein